MIKSSSSASLPSYKKPPVNEVVCGMKFYTPDQLRVPHIGLLWDKFRSDYPIIQHAVPIASDKGEIAIDAVTGVPLPRVWFVNTAEDQLIQFQVDRFYYNWRRKQASYPRYPYVIKNFTNTLNIVSNFFKNNNFGELKPTTYELSYINHIPQGEGWDTLDDLPTIFTDFIWSQIKSRFLPNPSRLTWKAEFPIKDNMGSLVISLKPATRTEGKLQLLVLEIVARGIDESKDLNNCQKWYDLAHEWIVKGFTDITTSKAHQLWEREQ